MAFLNSQGVQLYYEDIGSGDPIIWIHEFAADRRTWERQIRRFGREYRCIAYNARGYPPSDVPETDTAYSYEHQREDIVALMDGLGIASAHLVGLSMGAYSGLQFAMKYPDRTRSLVFSSGGSGPARNDADSYKRDIEVLADRIVRAGMETSANELALAANRIQLRAKDPRGWEEFRRHMAEHSALGSALTLKGFQAPRPSIYTYEADLRSLDVPVLLAVGDEDDGIFDVNIFLKRTLPRAGLWIHPHTGHGMNLEDPDAFNAQIASFLSAVERGAWCRGDSRGSDQPIMMAAPAARGSE